MSSLQADHRLPDDLAQGLRALPQATAGPGFAAAVRRRAASAMARRKRLQRRGLAVATVLCLVALGLGLQRIETVRDRVARRAAPLEEHRQLLGELDELRALADRRSLIHLGGDASTDLYLDLATVPAASSGVRSTTLTRSQG